ncbi:MAG: UDP-N-acetylmuramate dehydrogenase [Lachnospiraceae bacterium]|nr:UDP-N-acetylmuramate dehydrogenase [Lachnospiraceae bacterium]
MSDLDLINELKKLAGEGNVLCDEPMSKHTTFRAGGNAKYYVTVSDVKALKDVISHLQSKDIPFFLTGRGSNLLVSDKGYDGVILHPGSGYEDMSFSGNEVTTGAGASLISLAAAAADRGLSGLEFASGIPGSVGGAVFMNAGAYGGEIRDCLKIAEIFFYDGKLETYTPEELQLSYRHSCLKERPGCVLKAVFELNEDDPVIIRGRMEELRKKRLEKQPLEYPSAGSTFKRPEGFFAGKLISDAGLSGEHVGDAYVSEKHCGFIVNKGNASATDIHQLMVRVQSRVKECTGVTLEPEVIMLGEF